MQQTTSFVEDEKDKINEILDQIRPMIDKPDSLKDMEPFIAELMSMGQLNYKDPKADFNIILNQALYHRNVPLARYLLSESADPDIKNRYCENALTTALSAYWHHWKIIEEENFDLIELIIRKNPECLKTKLMGYGGNADTPLHQVALSGWLPLFILLVSKGASLHETNYHGTTPLQKLQWCYSDITASKIQEMVEERLTSTGIAPEDPSSNLSRHSTYLKHLKP
jgi:hypothetical protein